MLTIAVDVLGALLSRAGAHVSKVQVAMQVTNVSDALRHVRTVARRQMFTARSEVARVLEVNAAKVMDQFDPRGGDGADAESSACMLPSDVLVDAMLDADGIGKSPFALLTADLFV